MKRLNYRYYKKVKGNCEYFIKKLITDNDELLNRMEKEYLIVKKIGNFKFIPNVVDFSIDEKTITYNYINGKTLDRINGLSILNYIEILYNLVDALEKLHSKRIVHCDLKRNNIMIDSNNNLYLIDFDNACFIGEKTKYGTKRYCCIEQLYREKVSPFFDIYSLGIIMYEMFTGYKAFDYLSVKELLEEKKNKKLSICNIIINMPKICDEILNYFLTEKNFDYNYIKSELLKFYSSTRKTFTCY